MTQIDQDQDDIAFRDGVFARALGRPLSKSPHAKGSAEGARWEAGWRLIDARAPAIDRQPGASFDPHRRPLAGSRRELVLFFAIYLGSLSLLGGLLFSILIMTIK
jgi:hypothetical protein